MKKLLALLSVVGILWGTAGPALAEGSWGYYWHDTCTGGAHEFLWARLSNNTSFTNLQKTVIGDGIQAWNIQATGACTPLIQFDATVQEAWHDDCSMFADIIIEKVGPTFLPPLDGYAKTDQSVNQLTNKMLCAHVMFEDYTANDPEESYYGANDPEPTDRVGERGVLTHEIGHTLGSLHWEDTTPGYCYSYNDSPNPGTHMPAGFRTMCGGSYVGKLGEPRENLKMSLSFEDYTALNDSYN